MARNPVSEAVDILEDHYTEIDSEYTLLPILWNAMSNTNPRWLSLLHGRWEQMSFNDPLLLSNPVIFEEPEYRMQGADYVLK